jgi:hypothetical protein
MRQSNMKVSGQFHVFQDSLHVMADGKGQGTTSCSRHVTGSGSWTVIKTIAWRAKMYHTYVKGLKNAFLAHSCFFFVCKC